MGRLESYEVLKKLLWRAKSGDLDLDNVEVTVIDRAAPTGERIVRLGTEVILMKDRLIISDAQIPLHRLVEIRVCGESIWKRSGHAQRRS